MSSDLPEKPEKKEPKTGASGLVDSMKRKLSGDRERKPVPEPKVEMQEEAKPLEEEKKTLEAPPTSTTTKMVEPDGITLSEANPNMHRKHVTVLNQKASGARKYLRSK